MAEAHDNWLSGLGIDVDKVLKSLGPAVPQPLPLGLIDPDEVQAIAEGRYEGPGGESQVGGDGSQSGKGRLLKTDDGHGGSTDYFSGEYDIKPDGSGTVKGAVAKKTSQDGAVVETTGEVELSGDKIAVTTKKTEVDVAKLAGDALPEGTVFKFDVGEGTASAENSIRDDGASFGLQANVGEASVTVGTQNAKSDTDETSRIGLSEGEGAAARFHWGDADKDDNPEYGFGADIGPVSFDIKTEDPLRTALTKGVNSVIPGLGTLAEQTGLLGDENLTKQAKAGAEELADEAIEGGQELIDDAGELIDDAQEAAGEAIDEAQEAAGEAIDEAQEAAGEAIDEAQEVAGEAIDDAQEAIGEATEAAGEAIDDAKEAASEAVDDAKEAASEALDSAKEGLLDGVSSLLP